MPSDFSLFFFRGKYEKWNRSSLVSRYLILVLRSVRQVQVIYFRKSFEVCGGGFAEARVRWRKSGEVTPGSHACGGCELWMPTVKPRGEFKRGSSNPQNFLTFSKLLDPFQILRHPQSFEYEFNQLVYYSELIYNKIHIAFLCFRIVDVNHEL